MKGTEFIEMMRQDAATAADKQNLNAVVTVMEYVVTAHPGCDIEDDPANHKTPENCFKFLSSYASKNKKGNAYFMSPDESMRLVAEYLGLQPVAAAPASAPAVVDLESFL